MSIYTRTGDNGMTNVFGGTRVSKSDGRVEAYGSIDELSSHFGLVINKVNKKHQTLLKEIQRDLYLLMSHLSGAKMRLEMLEKEVGKLEDEIDRLENKLPALNKFILPRGTDLSCLFHIIRTICRRAERSIVRYLEKSKNKDVVSIEYINRLSDLFFMLARYYNNEPEEII